VVKFEWIDYNNEVEIIDCFENLINIIKNNKNKEYKKIIKEEEKICKSKTKLSKYKKKGRLINNF
jgi:Na+/phosphate symporter